MNWISISGKIHFDCLLKKKKNSYELLCFIQILYLFFLFHSLRKGTLLMENNLGLKKRKDGGSMVGEANNTNSPK